MTLDKVIMKLGRAVAESGVLFVALSRVRHPDDLMLDDSFPALFEILKQAKHPSFAKRQHWEKLMRARFARTLRLHMRDADLCTHPGTHVWNEDDALIAEKFLSIIRDNLQLSDDEIVVTLATHNPTLQQDDIHRIWQRLQTFPYVFEIAHARGNVDALYLDGTRKQTNLEPERAPVSFVQYHGWKVALKDFAALRTEDKLSSALLEHLAQCFREEAPSHLYLAIQAAAKKHDITLPPATYNAHGVCFACYPYVSPVGYKTLYILERDSSQGTVHISLRIHTLQHADVFDEHTRKTTHFLPKHFPQPFSSLTFYQKTMRLTSIS